MFDCIWIRVSSTLAGSSPNRRTWECVLKQGITENRRRDEEREVTMAISICAPNLSSILGPEAAPPPAGLTPPATRPTPRQPDVVAENRRVQRRKKVPLHRHRHGGHPLTLGRKERRRPFRRSGENRVVVPAQTPDRIKLILPGVNGAVEKREFLGKDSIKRRAG